MSALEKRRKDIPVSKFKELLTLFLAMLKIGTFTFGGGYAMISLLEGEFVSKKKYLTEDEFIDLVTIAESTPGPIAINCSTYIGYKVGGFFGACVSTLAMCLPSFVIIYLISLFLNSFLEIPLVAAAFRGIQVAVLYLIFTAGIKMFRAVPKTPFSITLFTLTFLAVVLFTLFGKDFSAILAILASAAIGLSLYLIRKFKERKENTK